MEKQSACRKRRRSPEEARKECQSSSSNCRFERQCWWSVAFLFVTFTPHTAEAFSTPRHIITRSNGNTGSRWTPFTSPFSHLSTAQSPTIRSNQLFRIPSGDNNNKTNGDESSNPLREFTNGDEDSTDGDGSASFQTNDSNLDSTTVNATEKDEQTNNNNLLVDDNAVPLNYSCRIVTASDGKIPTKESLLPESLFEPPVELLAKLDSIYHAVAHETTRGLKFMEKNSKGGGSSSSNSERQSFDVEEEEEVIQVLRTSLEDAGFELLSRRDLDLCEALNAEYLLRLSIQDDLAELDDNISREFFPECFDQNGTRIAAADANNNDHSSQRKDFLYDGRVLVFWRGYGQELTRGRLLLPKIDYLQANIVQRVAFSVRRRLNIVEETIARQSKTLYRKVEYSTLSAAQNAIEMIPSKRVSNWTRSAFINAVERKKREERIEKQKRKEEKVFKLQRYGGYRKGLFVSSPNNPNDALTPFMICEVDYGDSANGVNGDNNQGSVAAKAINANQTTVRASDLQIQMDSSEAINHDIYEYLNKGRLTCQYDEAMKQEQSSGINQPMQLLERVSISNLVDFSPQGRRNVLKTLFAKNELLEPTYEEVVVVWRPLPPKPEREQIIRPPKFIYDFADMFDIQGLPELPRLEEEEEEPARPALEIRAFAGVPMANLPAVLPKTKLVFRPADAFVFDLVSIFSFVLVLGSQRFDNPRLDLLALVSFVLWVVRTVFRYSNKLARYDLLVKKFLTSKITHRNSGALKYVTTEAGSYRATRAALVYTWLTSSDRQVTSGASNRRDQLIEAGLVGVNELIREDKQVRVDIDAALRDLEDLGLVRFSEDGQRLDSVIRDTSSLKTSLSHSWARVFEGGKRLVDKARVRN